MPTADRCCRFANNYCSIRVLVPSGCTQCIYYFCVVVNTEQRARVLYTHAVYYYENPKAIRNPRIKIQFKTNNERREKSKNKIKIFIKVCIIQHGEQKNNAGDKNLTLKNTRAGGTSFAQRLIRRGNYEDKNSNPMGKR